MRSLAVALLAIVCVAGCDDVAEACDVGAFAVVQPQVAYAQPFAVQQFAYAAPVQQRVVVQQPQVVVQKQVVRQRPVVVRQRTVIRRGLFGF